MSRLALLVAFALILPAAAWAQAGGVAGGSSTAQYLFQQYDQQLAQAAAQQINAVLPVVSGIMFGISCVLVTLLAKRAMFGSASMDMIITYAVRLTVVGFLLVPANFNSTIVTLATTTIPNQIVQTAGNGNQNTTVAQGFDGLLNEVTNFTAKAEKQMSGTGLAALTYIPERISIVAYAGIAKFFIYCTEVIFAIVLAVIPFLLPVVALFLPFSIFEATNQFFMRIVGKLVALFVVMFLSVQLAAFIVKINGNYMQQFATLVPATAPQANFQMNAGDSLFTSMGLSAIADQGGIPLANNGGNTTAATTANVEAAIETMENMAFVCAFGYFILMISTGIAMFLGGAHGFSFGPLTNAVSAGVTKGLRLAGRLAR